MLMVRCAMQHVWNVTRFHRSYQFDAESTSLCVSSYLLGLRQTLASMFPPHRCTAVRLFHRRERYVFFFTWRTRHFRVACLYTRQTPSGKKSHSDKKPVISATCGHVTGAVLSGLHEYETLCDCMARSRDSVQPYSALLLWVVDCRSHDLKAARKTLVVVCSLAQLWVRLYFIAVTWKALHWYHSNCESFRKLSRTGSSAVVADSLKSANFYQPPA